MTRFLFILICLLSVSFTAVGIFTSNAEAAKRCVIVAKQGTREVLINRCAECRRVKIERKRSNGGFSTHRNFTIPKGATTQLPFRGRGYSRIATDQPCTDTGVVGPADQKCIVIQNSTKLGPVLVNTCTDCRMALIEVREPTGQRVNKTYAVAGRSYIPFRTAKALDARILKQAVCKR